MKKLLVTLTMLTLSVSSQTFKRIDTQYGFNSIKFESSVKTFTDMILVKDDTLVSQKVYKKQNDFKCLMSYPVSDVEYVFFNDSLQIISFKSNSTLLYLEVYDKMYKQKKDGEFSIRSYKSDSTKVRDDYYSESWFFEEVTVTIKHPIDLSGDYKFSISSNYLTLYWFLNLMAKYK